MSLEDFIDLYEYKGFIFRSDIDYDEITYEFFANKDYDYTKWGKCLIDAGEKAPFNHDRPIM